MGNGTSVNLRVTRPGVLQSLPAIFAISILAVPASQHPGAALLLLLAAAVLVLLLKSPAAAAGLLVIVLPLNRWAPYVGFYLRPYYLAAMLVLMLYVWYWASGQLRPVRLNMADIAVAGFFVCCMLSFLVSSELGWSVRKLMSLVWVSLVYLAIRVAIQNKKTLQTVIASAGVSMGLLAAGGVLVAILFLQRQMFPNLVLAYFGLPRLTYLNTDPNYYALHVGTYLAFTLALLLLQPRSGVRAKWLLIVLLGMNVTLTLSRGATLALLALLLTMAVVFRARISRRMAVVAVIVVVCVAVIGAAFTPTWVWMYQWERLVGTVQDLTTGQDLRLPQFQAAWNNFIASPILGIGIGVSRAWEQYWRHAHCIVLEILQDTGLVGFIGYVLMVGTVVRMGLQVVRRCSDSYLQSVAGALLVAMLYFHFQALTLNAVQDVMLWALMGLIVAVAIIAEKQQSQQLPQSEPGRYSQ